MGKIRCENSMCIYEKNGLCILDEIEINVLGMCDECILPNFDEKSIKAAKRETLKRILEREEYY